MSRNLLVGNNAISTDPFTKNAIVLKNGYDALLNLGFDTGLFVEDNVEQAYGIYPVSLAENDGKIKAGRTIDSEVIKTLMIAPKMVNSKGEMFVGSANLHNYEGTKETYFQDDQRGYRRSGEFDIGSIEISSVIYDANGGNFSLPKLSSYDGKTYYEGEKPEQFAKVGNPRAEYSILDGKKKLKPVRAGYEFLGWSDNKSSSNPNIKYNVGTKHQVVDQLILFAVWKENKYQLKYYGNGKTSGVSPIQKTIFSSKEVTIKSQCKLKRKGYKFSGWSTKPSSKKGEVAYAPGKKIKLVKNTKLYAIWKR